MYREGGEICDGELDHFITHQSEYEIKEKKEKILRTRYITEEIERILGNFLNAPEDLRLLQKKETLMPLSLFSSTLFHFL